MSFNTNIGEDVKRLIKYLRKKWHSDLTTKFDHLFQKLDILTIKASGELEEVAINYLNTPSFNKKSKELKIYNFTRPYYLCEMNAILKRYSFEDKVVCEIGSDPFLECSRAAMLLGAKEVHSYDYGLRLDDSYDDKIKVHKYHFGQGDIPEKKFDLIFAIATLEHIPDIESFARNIFSALKPGGNAFIQGEPLWLSAKGHHLWIDRSDVKYHFDDVSNPLDDWYHLSRPSKDQFEKDMINKGINTNEISFFWESIYERNHINRKTPDELIHYFQYLDNVEIEIFRNMNYRKQNTHFEIARKSYPEEDLRTSGLTIFLTKK